MSQPLYIRGVCQVCGKTISIHGRASHGFMHLDRNEARAEIALMGGRYEFFVKRKSPRRRDSAVK
jgi:hypothetical protein